MIRSDLCFQMHTPPYDTDLTGRDYNIKLSLITKLLCKKKNLFHLFYKIQF